MKSFKVIPFPVLRSGKAAAVGEEACRIVDVLIERLGQLDRSVEGFASKDSADPKALAQFAADVAEMRQLCADIAEWERRITSLRRAPTRVG